MVVEKIKTLVPLSIKKSILSLFVSTRRYFVELHELYHDVQQIHDLDIDKELRKKIRNTRILTFYFRKFDKKNNIAKIVGNKIRFTNFNILKGLFSEIFISQCYWFTATNSEPKIIDCGSHFGQSIIYFKTIYPNSKIVCFEPDNHTFSLLTQNLNTNNVQDVEMNNMAISDFDGKLSFYNMEGAKSSVAMSTIKERIPNGIESIVKATRLSNYINETIDFLKMDIEGAELSVLKELVKSDKLKYVKQMVIEYHHHIKEHEDHFSHTLELLEDADFGYQIEGEFLKPRKEVHFQDIMIYAYNKKL